MGDNNKIAYTEPIIETNTGEEKEQTLGGVITSTALKTTACLLVFILLFFTMLSFAHPGTADVYRNLRLYEKAVIAAECDFSRKQAGLDNIYADSDYYNEYFENKYMPSLTRLADYSIEWLVKKPGKQPALYVSKYSELFLNKDNRVYSYNNIDVKNMNKLPDKAKILVYNYRAYLKEYMFKSAALLYDDALLKSRISFLFEGDMYSVLEGAKTSGTLGNMFGVNFIPDWALGGYIDTMLSVVDYSRPASVVEGFLPENVHKTVNPDKYSHMTFRALYEKSTGFSNMYSMIKSYYANLKTVRNSADFAAMTRLEDKLLYLWYDRVVSNLSYSMASVLCTIWAMNSNTLGLGNYPDTQIQSAVTAEKDYWLELSELDSAKFTTDNNTL